MAIVFPHYTMHYLLMSLLFLAGIPGNTQFFFSMGIPLTATPNKKKNAAFLDLGQIVSIVYILLAR